MCTAAGGAGSVSREEIGFSGKREIISGDIGGFCGNLIDKEKLVPYYCIKYIIQ